MLSLVHGAVSVCLLSLRLCLLYPFAFFLRGMSSCSASACAPNCLLKFHSYVYASGARGGGYGFTTAGDGTRIVSGWICHGMNRWGI